MMSFNFHKSQVSGAGLHGEGKQPVCRKLLVKFECNFQRDSNFLLHTNPTKTEAEAVLSSEVNIVQKSQEGGREDKHY